MTAGPRVSVAVEGESDTGMVGTLLAHVGISLARPCLVKRGVTNLDRLIPGLSRTSINNPWVVFRDSDLTHDILVGCGWVGASFR